MNEVILIGRLTKDPELRYTQSQMAVCNFTLAVDRNRRRGQDPNEQAADFIRITAWGNQAENCSRYLLKGRQAAVQGRIQTGTYTNRDGRTVYTTDVVANRVEFIGNRPEQNNPQKQDSYPQQRDYATGEPVPPQRSDYPSGNDDLPEGFQAIDEDDIPF